MTKEFVPYEQALALKKLGFDEPCLGYYNDYKNISSHSESPFMMCDYNHSEEEEDSINPISVPSYQQAFRWFREKHDLQASNIMFSNGKYDTGITRYKGTQSVWGHGPIYNTYEEAELACLIELIQIVKTQQKI